MLSIDSWSTFQIKPHPSYPASKVQIFEVREQKRLMFGHVTYTLVNKQGQKFPRKAPVNRGRKERYALKASPCVDFVSVPVHLFDSSSSNRNGHYGIRWAVAIWSTRKRSGEIFQRIPTAQKYCAEERIRFCGKRLVDSKRQRLRESFRNSMTPEMRTMLLTT